MTLDEFLANYLDDLAFKEPNITFWVRTAIEGMAFLGPETDANIERFSRLVLDYYAGGNVDRETANGIRQEMMCLGVDISGRNQTPLGHKCRALWAVAFSREDNAADSEHFRYGVCTAFQNINQYHNKDQTLIDFIRESAKEQGVDLHEPHCLRLHGGSR